MKASFPILLFISLIFLSCNRDGVVREPITDFGDPFQIVSLIEIVNDESIDRTNMIPDCRKDDLFLFHGPTQDVRIQAGASQCEETEEEFNGGTWTRTEVDNLEGTLMTIQLHTLYVLHDSLLFGQSELRFMQAYEIVKIEENELIIQSHPNFSTPKTQNTWQLKLSR